MKSQIYNQPKYYEIAFSFADAKKQVKLFEKFINKYSKIPVKRVLDIACGPALQLREFAKHKYIATGIDSNPQMINYLRKISREEKIKISTIKANMNQFRLARKVDFAYIMMGSIMYTKNSQFFLFHLDSVANSLNTGGLYLIENLTMNWSDPKLLKSQSWTARDQGIKVKTTYKITLKNSLTQLVVQDIIMEVNDNGYTYNFIDKDELKIIFPEEFKLLVEKNNKFEFLGFFERCNVRKLKNMCADNIILLRKK